MRATFEVAVESIDFASLADRVQHALDGAGGSIEYRRAGDHFLVSLPKGDQHLWSPWLHLDVRRAMTAEADDSLFGRVTPSPSLWTAMMFSILTIVVLGAGGAVFGYSQWIVGESPWALWFVPGAAVALVLGFLADRAGRSAAARQIASLTEPLEREFRLGALGTTDPSA